MSMELLLAFLVVGFMALFVFVGYIFRHSRLSRVGFIFLMAGLGGTGVYVGMIVLGAPYNAGMWMWIFVASGALLGLQGARVVIHVGKLEAGAAEKKTKIDS